MSEEKITCRRCGRAIEKRGVCPHCEREEMLERRSVNWGAIEDTRELIRLDVEIENKYKNAG